MWSGMEEGVTCVKGRKGEGVMCEMGFCVMCVGWEERGCDVCRVGWGGGVLCGMWEGVMCVKGGRL